MTQLLSRSGVRRFLLRWRTRASKAAAFTMADWAVLIEGLFTLPVVSVGLHALEFPRVLGWAKRRSASAGAHFSDAVGAGLVGAGPVGAGRSDKGLSDAGIERIAWFAGVAARPTPFRCLTRSLTLVRLLARRGVSADIRIGVRTEDGLLRAHAWVEWQGRALNDNERALQGFARFDRVLGDTLHV